jgi:hypothetical protein
MKTHLVVPVPLDDDSVWDIFRPHIKRFTDTYRQFPPGAEHTIMAVCNKADATAEVKAMFDGMPVEWLRYDGDGADLGSQQFVAESSTDNVFQVNLTTRTHAHREGWLTHLVKAREKYGPGLYGITASNEGGRLHICTRAHSYDTRDFRFYPTKITSRDFGVFFELGRGCLLEWFLEFGRPAYVVTWDRIWRKPEWFDIPNGYRRGDQRNCLLFDKHTERYADANDAERERLTAMMEGRL